MGRLAKKGLEYFPMDIDMFQDIRIRKLIKYQGGASVSVYTLLLCLIYKDGYYMRWDNELPFIVSEITGLEEKHISEVIKCCLSIGLFDKNLYEKEKVLTSRSIQQRYCNIKRLNKRLARIDEYRLIEEPPMPPAKKPQEGTPQRRQARAKPTPRKEEKPVAKPRPEAPAPQIQQPAAPCSLKDVNAEYMRHFFAEARKESLNVLCKNFGFKKQPDDFVELRKLAESVIADWELSDVNHTCFTDWSKHLISTMRIKLTEVKKQQGNNHKCTPAKSEMDVIQEADRRKQREKEAEAKRQSIENPRGLSSAQILAEAKARHGIPSDKGIAELLNSDSPIE